MLVLQDKYTACCGNSSNSNSCNCIYYKRDSRTGALILVSAMTAGYFIIALINSTIGTWTYALPLVIAAMIYLDIKMMMVMNAVIIISSVIRLVMQLGNRGYQFFRMM